jgi:zinc transport system ATP-binding protein
VENANGYVLNVSNLTVRLQNQTIIDNVSFKVKTGTTLAVLGPNGAGKTMLFRTLLNLVPHEGKIEWEEKVKIGYVPQNIAVGDIPLSVREFLAFRNAKNVASCLEAVRLDEKDLSQKRLGILSGGQMRRVLIAWALIDNPNVLLLDEPTTGVDIGGEEPILVMLNDLKKTMRMTILLITHDVHIVNEYSDSLLGLNKCVTFFGESKEIMNPTVQRTLYGEMVCIGAPKR